MKTLLEEMLLALLMGTVIPGLLLSGLVWIRERQPSEPEPVLRETEAPAAKKVPLSVRVRKEDETVEEGDMDAYLVGVVLAEMPAYFESEALKAQAVVARTYARRAWETGGKHGDGSVCGDYACCQAYISQEDYLARGGREEDVEKIRAAVLETSGQVLTYDGNLIEATYFSCSGGQTEDAEAVWGTDFPYLRSVESPGEEEAAHYRDTVSFSAGEFQKLLDIQLPGSPDSWFGEVTYTTGGGVDTVSIGGTLFRGTQLRQLLGLRSTVFSVAVEADQIHIHTKGYGHRVGMSQYGADAMAVAGSDYTQILAHYYQGTELTEIPG